MVYLGVRIPKTLEQQLRAMADADHRSLAEYVRLLLIKHTEEETGE
jgi:predicted HicB family RNase H-like nuclease